jgi:uncharacterized membrane protein YecN with MAPEG domain
LQLPITTLFGTLFVLVTLILAASTSLFRMRVKSYSVPGEPGPLYRLNRAHGNSAEWLAASVLLIAFLELQGANPRLLLILASALLLARVWHSVNMLLKTGLGPISATIMYGCCFFMAGWALHLRLR